jgi:DNA invertase Pin-like site-specific DNA recombinase
MLLYTFMLVGYARISTTEQNLDLQRDALEHAGCTKLFTETASGAKLDRPALRQAIEYVRAGDVLVVWKLDRLGRSLKQLIETVTELQERGIEFKSLTENIDTTTSAGKLIFHLFGSLAEFERDLIRERTQAGLTAARARGRSGGRPRAEGLNDDKKLALARSLYNDKQNSIETICKTLKVSRSTLYRYISARESTNTTGATDRNLVGGIADDSIPR